MCERILLIEDDPNLRKILAAALSYSKYNVTPVANGLDALSKASRQSFDLIITDLIKPVMDANEFIKELAKIADPPPVIMLTGDTAPIETEPDSPVKITCFRPISLYSLLEVVRNVLHSNLITNSTRPS